MQCMHLPCSTKAFVIGLPRTTTRHAAACAAMISHATVVRTRILQLHAQLWRWCVSRLCGNEADTVVACIDGDWHAAGQFRTLQEASIAAPHWQHGEH